MRVVVLGIIFGSDFPGTKTKLTGKRIYNYVVYTFFGQHDMTARPVTSGLWCVDIVITATWPFAQ
jgi:hypothetical protein